jgi:hypothetical protein
LDVTVDGDDSPDDSPDESADDSMDDSQEDDANHYHLDEMLSGVANDLRLRDGDEGDHGDESDDDESDEQDDHDGNEVVDFPRGRHDEDE